MNVRYRGELSQTEPTALTAILSGGTHAARRLKRTQILLAADAGASDEEIARNLYQLITNKRPACLIHLTTYFASRIRTCLY